jgi:hypothetical protein
VDPLAHEMHVVQARRQELEAVAATFRMARRCTRPAGPSLVLRLYARLWWASRPRTAAWAPGLFGPRSA